MKQQLKICLLLLMVSILSFSMISPAFAHPGRTDASGCHTCRTNCASWGLSTGEYHCHRAKALPQPIEPIKSHKVEGGTGYTTPAPEYKVPKVEEKPNTTANQDTPKPIESIKPAANDNKPNFWGRVLSFFGWR